MKKLGIYIHIPFCKRKCNYCDFVSFSGKQKLIEQYINSLKKEISNCKVNKENYLVETIYFGGGTPSYIESKFIIDILQIIKQKFKKQYKYIKRYKDFNRINKITIICR